MYARDYASYLIVFFISILLFSAAVFAQQDKCYVEDNEVPCPDDKPNEIPNVDNKGIVNEIGNKDNNNQIGNKDIGDSWRGDLDVLPDTPDKYKQNNGIFLTLFVITILLFAALLFFKTKIFSKTLPEYIFPIKYYILIAMLTAITQYLIIGLPLPYLNKVIMLPFLSEYSVVLRLTQALWALMVALSVWQLVKEHDFNFRQIFFVGILYSIAIHGLKISIRYFFYDRPFYYLADRFLYGSLLVMVIVIPLGLLFVYLKKKKVKLDW